MSRALFVHGANKARVAQFNLREGRAGEVLMQVASVGVCGSDLHYFKDGGIGATVIKEPFVPGHEFGGYLCEDVEELGLTRGQLVAVDPNKACGQCDWCREGHHNLCPNVEFIGAPPFDGAMTERIWAPKSQLVALPESFDALDAVMLEPLGVAIHAVKLAKPRMLERVAVLGCGPIGLLIVQVLKATGAGEVFACDPLAHRRAMAERIGADRVGETAADLIEWSKGGCPLVMEATNSPFGFRDAVTATRIGGRIVLVGIPDGDIYTLPAADARRRGLNIKFARRMGDVYPLAIEFLAAGKVDVRSIVTHRIGLEETPGVLTALAENAPGYVKVLVDLKRI
ncbi:zinc-dependent alcohol dehydrogenase [Bradyrhizobium australiense]|uniref:Alcohol dehydrogenase catalytic domain-containing protein n=1 Tax=Bradyrhizobium australiense TaxID=2721161 RepID=A0A7Y4GYF5_9BRAD|nr:alcohol dehydrogenase catalytic domain-containing protein [Bradyrhizobium australiense]NOJ43647.1 alcohol dehydrogenase catalytic domain-containing protein [Bradyrhizobium australiense]